MARRSLKVTGFTCFMLVMIIVAPLAYIGASYYNGEDGIQNIKNLLNIGDKTESVKAPASAETVETAETKAVNQSPSAKGLEEEVNRLKEELEFKSKRVDELYLENEQLKRMSKHAIKQAEDEEKTKLWFCNL